MTLVCLWRPSPTGAAAADSATDGARLAADLLRHAPRVRLEADGIVWADGRGLDAPRLARALWTVLHRGRAEPRAGVAATPVAAEIAARRGERPITVVPAGGDRDFLAPFPLDVLVPPPDLRVLLRGAGVERCGELARLAQAAVEVRFGAVGVGLWRLARADDRRLLFAPPTRALPDASLSWTDYALDRPEPLVFLINRLVGTVCTALRERGEGATGFTLVFALADGRRIEQPFRPPRVGADPKAWMRLVRHELERLRLPDGVTGLTLRVDSARPAERIQGDLLDRGFASAGAAADALATVLERDAVLVTPEVSRHALLRRRTRWRPQEPALVWARPQIGAGDTEPALALDLLPEPEPVEVVAADRHGFAAPVRYRDGAGGWHQLVAASGPDCLSGDAWDDAYAYEVYCGVREDGELVQLARDARRDRWELHGVWR